jgi:hypothetical protein
MRTTADLSLSIRALIDAGRAAPSADNSQPWRFIWDGRYLRVKYDHQRVANKTFGPHEHATLLAMGALKENILQMAAFLGIDVIQVASGTSEPYFQFEFNLTGNMNTPTREHPLFQRHTNRFPYRSDPIPSQFLESLTAMSQGQCRALIYSDRGLIKKLGAWVRIASEVRFQSRDVHEFLAHSLRFTAEETSQGDGLDVRTLPLPPGGKAFLRLIKDWDRLAVLNRFGCYKFLSLMEERPVSKATSLICIAGPDGSNGALDAGALMERIWIYLNAEGIGVQPYYVITDQLQRLKAGKISAPLSPFIKTIQSEVKTVLRSESNTLQMLLRIGYPKNTPIRSNRLPMERVISFDVTQREGFSSTNA